ncbi:MAG TPA: pseudouridine-5'-phosphate glycosidase [Gaiellaceae bacterium]
MIELGAEAAEALADFRPVVALETTLVAHGFPAGEGLEVALEAERRVRAGGAVPATIGVLDGAIRVGLSRAELERFAEAGSSALKTGPRELGLAVARRALGATTAGGTLAVCALTGIRFLATGGIGGVHRGFARHPDVSADLGELARSEALVVCSGVKSLLDVPATLEALETLGVPVLGWQSETLPLFYSAHGGPPVPARVDSLAEAAALARAHWSLRRGGLLLARPPAESLEAEPLFAAALEAANAAGIRGAALTPFALAHVHRASGGASIRVNKGLIADNAQLAAELAVAYASG